MTDIAPSYAEATSQASAAKPAQPYRIEETHWGYIVSAGPGLDTSIRVAQAISMVCFSWRAVRGPHRPKPRRGPRRYPQ